MSPSSQGGKVFFTKYGGPSGGSPLSGGGKIILRVIRRHFLAAAVDPAVSLSMHSSLPMEVSVDHIDHAAPRGDDAEPGKTRQCLPTRRGVRGFTGSLRCEAAVAAE